MHVPDGFLDAPTSVATGVVAAAGVAVALRGARRELDDRTAPLAGLVATFVFAAQMLNFPVGAGTSGHLLGGALAAVLVGPCTGVLCLSVVLLVQGLLFADGGITALGTNITLMAVVGVGVGWLVFRALQRGAARSGCRWSRSLAGGRRAGLGARRGRWPSSGSTPSAGRRRSRSTRSPPRCSAGTRSSASARRSSPGSPSAASSRSAPTSSTAPGRVLARRGRSRSAAPTGAGGMRRPATRFLLGGLLVALLLAGVASYYASADPDGLEHVAEQTRASRQRRRPRRRRRPARRLRRRRASTTPALAGGLAGVVGVAGRPGAGRRARLRRAPPPPSPTRPTPSRPAALGPGLMGAGHGHRLHYHGHSPVHRARRT